MRSSCEDDEMIELRRARLDDARFLYDVANDPVTRAMSFTSGPIEWATHVAWLDRVLTDPERRLWVAELDGVPVGTCRLDVSNGCEVVSVAVEPDCRGQGLAVPIIEALCREARLPLVAEIKAENVASVRVFERAGFLPDGPGRWVYDGGRQSSAHTNRA